MTSRSFADFLSVQSKVALIAALSFSLSSCSSNPENAKPASSAQVEKDRLEARAKLSRMLEAKKQKQAAEAEQQRLAEEKAAQAAVEAAKPHYDPIRLKTAGSIRQWDMITVPDLNIQCWLKSNWKDGSMNIRLALLGDKTAIRLFTANWKYFKLVFTDAGGNNLHEARLATRDLQWADSMKNGGTPTMEFESSTECPLEVYESMIQWNLKWEN
ncbi:MAG: hypothetical protein K2X27_24980 [Candidatus Obscuribacterales bacterium]|nr:hypothetical protein [Candidatus Obscuribacterales bacterium]